jgi:hypothetical protein
LFSKINFSKMLFVIFAANLKTAINIPILFLLAIIYLLAFALGNLIFIIVTSLLFIPPINSLFYLYLPLSFLTLTLTLLSNMKTTSFIFTLAILLFLLISLRLHLTLTFLSTTTSFNYGLFLREP